MNINLLLRDTKAFKTFKLDMENNEISHAYLILCADSVLFPEILKFFSKQLLCEKKEACGECRVCRLIDENKFYDAKFYGLESQKILTADVEDLLENVYTTPLESDIKIYGFANLQKMNEQSQNKILKILEEPPKNVHLIFMSCNSDKILPTVLSRVKKIEIPLFSSDTIFESLKSDYLDLNKLKIVASSCNGLLSVCQKLMSDEKYLDNINLVFDLFINMLKSKDVLKYSIRITSQKENIPEMLSLIKVILRDMLMFKSGNKNLITLKERISEIGRASLTFNESSLIYALERVGESEMNFNYNANSNMLIDSLLMSILEGKYKWRKL